LEIPTQKKRKLKKKNISRRKPKKYISEKRISGRPENGQRLVKKVKKYKD
jgi:hypothetical protein